MQLQFKIGETDALAVGAMQRSQENAFHLCVVARKRIVNQLSKGDKVNVSFDINGREWNGKYFVNLVAWKIDAGAKAAAGGDEPPPFDPADEILDEEPPF